MLIKEPVIMGHVYTGDTYIRMPSGIVRWSLRTDFTVLRNLRIRDTSIRMLSGIVRWSLTTGFTVYVCIDSLTKGS